LKFIPNGKTAFTPFIEVSRVISMINADTIRFVNLNTKTIQDKTINNLSFERKEIILLLKYFFVLKRTFKKVYRFKTSIL
jgi:hypothetical protein